MSVFRQYRRRHMAAYLILAISASMMLALHSLEDQISSSGEAGTALSNSSMSQKRALSPFAAPFDSKPVTYPLADTITLISPDDIVSSSRSKYDETCDAYRSASDLKCQARPPLDLVPMTTLDNTAVLVNGPLHKHQPRLWWRLSCMVAAALHTLGYLILLAPYLGRRPALPKRESPKLPRADFTHVESNAKYDALIIFRMIDDGCPNIDM